MLRYSGAGALVCEHLNPDGCVLDRVARRVRATHPARSGIVWPSCGITSMSRRRLRVMSSRSVSADGGTGTVRAQSLGVRALAIEKVLDFTAGGLDLYRGAEVPALTTLPFAHPIAFPPAL